MQTENIYDKLYKRIMNSNERVTRDISYQYFTVDQLKNIRRLYLKKRYLNVAETSIMLGICNQTVYRLIKEGKIVLKDNAIYDTPYVIDIVKTKEFIPLDV